MKPFIKNLVSVALAGLVLTACMQREESHPPVQQETLYKKPITAPIEPVTSSALSAYPAAGMPAAGMAAPMPMPGPAGAAGRPVKIGLLLPLTGKSANLGKAMSDAGLLALFDKAARGGPRVVMLTQDTGDTPSGAQAAAQKVIDQGAELIIGPVFSASVEAIYPMAKAKGINIITFSNSPGAAQDGVYLFGFMPTQQAERIAQYAMNRGITQFAALAPSNDYGNTVTSGLERAVSQRGGKVSPVQLYAAERPDLGKPMAALSEAYAATPFQALFVPEGGDKLAAVAQAIGMSQLPKDKIKLLGSGAWDDANTIRSRELMGGWFAGVSPGRYKQFENRFIQQYGYTPIRLASLAYDAVALAATLAASPEGPNFSMLALTNPAGFHAPANGIFRFNRDGTSQRGLAILEVTPQGFREIDPAPTGF